jgi:putative transposase
MADSLDLRKRVVDYVENGGGITKAAVLFKVGRATIYRWLGREDLRATKVEHRERKIDWEALRKDVEENPEARLRERARKFGVRASAICYALKKMKITRKKTISLEKKEERRKNKILQKTEKFNLNSW